jgi:fluoride exporter
VPADRRELLAIFAGGFLGAVARALVAEALPHDPSAWPWATLAVNLAGAFALGWFATRLREPVVLSFVGTGVCGALTTFSALQLELLRMLDGDHVMLAAGYAGASLVGGLLAVAAATTLARGARLAP